MDITHTRKTNDGIIHIQAKKKNGKELLASIRHIDKGIYGFPNTFDFSIEDKWNICELVKEKHDIRAIY